MKKSLLILCLLFFLAGCASSAQPAPVEPTLPPTSLSPTAGNPASATSAPTALPKPVAGPTIPTQSATPTGPTVQPTGVQAVLTQTSGSLTVFIDSEQDVEVAAPQYVISGRAPAGTVLSVNDQIAVVDASQAFTIPVSLDEGPNLVEVVASDDSGDEVSFLLTITYSS